MSRTPSSTWPRPWPAGFGPDAPDPVVTGGYRLGDVRHVVASPRRAADVLGFEASTSFADGMRRFATQPLRRPPISTRPTPSG